MPLLQSQRTLINEQASCTHEQARMRMSPFTGRPLKVKITQICAKKAVQKAAACMPVLLASSINALSPPIEHIESQEVTNFLTYRFRPLNLQI